ncbi:hypothetical protein [Streptomyces sp. NPDC057199]
MPDTTYEATRVGLSGSPTATLKSTKSFLRERTNSAGRCVTD